MKYQNTIIASVNSDGIYTARQVFHSYNHIHTWRRLYKENKHKVNANAHHELVQVLHLLEHTEISTIRLCWFVIVLKYHGTDID